MRAAYALLLLLLLPPTATAVELFGSVIGIADGDTLTLLDASRVRHRIRLDGIDAPERSQPFGQRAHESLTELTQGRTVHAACGKTDRYGRAVCNVTVDGLDVGLEQVRRGLAWHYVRYAREQSPQERVDYARAEAAARAASVGLWSGAQPTAPWDYRRERAAGAH